MDFRLSQDKGYFDIDFESGDFAKTDSLDTAIFMSVFCEKRAEQLNDPTQRRGHLTNLFSEVSGYEVGSLLWLYTEQAKNTTQNLSQVESAVNSGLQWMIDDKIISNVKVKASKTINQISIQIDLINKLQNVSKYYNLFAKI